MKNFILLLAVSLILGGVYFYFTPTLTPIEKIAAQDEAAINIGHTTNAETATKLKTASADISVASADITAQQIPIETFDEFYALLSEEDKLIFDTAAATLRSHSYDLGYISEEELAPYKIYSDELLLSLIQTGDLAAIFTMIERYMDQGNRKAGNQLYIEAIIRGSVNGIYWTAMSSFAAATRALRAGDKVAYHQLMIEAEAWHEFGRMRDYYEPFLSDPNHPIPEELQNFRDIEAITTRAEELFRTLESSRHKLGLGNYENSNVKAYHDALFTLINLNEKHITPDEDSDD